MAILNYTTKIDSYKTISEIQQLLSKHGATKIIVDNDENRLPSAITFCIDWNDRMQAFALPCNFKGVLKAMQRQKSVPRSMCNEEQALRTGWRIIKVWIEAQMAFIESDLASMAEIFLPYAVIKTGETLYQSISNNDQLLLN